MGNGVVKGVTTFEDLCTVWHHYLTQNPFADCAHVLRRKKLQQLVESEVRVQLSYRGDNVVDCLREDWKVVAAEEPECAGVLQKWTAGRGWEG